MPKLKVVSSYGITPNHILCSKDISFKAKGLFGYLQSKPENRDFSADRIANLEAKESRDAILTGLQELEQSGYLERHKFKNEKGQWDIEYTLYETPQESDDHPPEEEAPIEEEEIVEEEVVIEGETRSENPTWDEKTRSDYPTWENPTTENPTTNKEIPIKKDLVINTLNINPEELASQLLNFPNGKEKEKSSAKKEKERESALTILKTMQQKYQFVIDFLDFENPQIAYQAREQGHAIYIGKQFLEVDKLLKDGYNLETIGTVLSYIKQDDFRKTNILSIRKLREKDKNGIPYIVRMIEKIQNWTPPKSKTTIGSLPGL